MRGLRFHHTSAILVLAAGVVILLLFSRQVVWADSLVFLTDLKYEGNKTQTTQKSDNTSVETDGTLFSQIYSLDLQKEIMPNLSMTAGGLFDQDSRHMTTTDLAGSDSESRDSAIRPYVDFNLNTPILQAGTGYHKNQSMRSTTGSTTRTFSEEYSANLAWKPIELPIVNLEFSRNQTHDQPLTRESRTDIYQLRSNYRYQDYAFQYNHLTSDGENKTAGSTTLANSDNGRISFNRSYQQRKFAVTSSVYAGRQTVEFSGPADRLVPTTSPGVVIGSAEDPTPETSNPDDNFVVTGTDLVVDPLDAHQFSFGLDFGSPTEVDRLFVVFNPDDQVSHNSTEFPWSLYGRDNVTENWTKMTPDPQVITNPAENRFELAFPMVKKRYIKIVTTPMVRTLPNDHLRISNLAALRTLPPDTSEFSSIDWSGDFTLDWKMTAKTSMGYDVFYREQSSDSLDSKETLLATGVRLRHIFSAAYVGNLRFQHSITDSGEQDPSTSDTFSAALAADYLKTLNQRLTYSFSRQQDETGSRSNANVIFLRTNLDLYKGWSMFVDNGYSLLHEEATEDTATLFGRIGSNIIPNRWMNFTVTSGVSSKDQQGATTTMDIDTTLEAAWVPTPAFSLSANLIFTDKTNETASGEVQKESTTDQRYTVSWSPLRDGNLNFQLSYGQAENPDHAKIWNLSPTLRWQINHKTLLTLQYGLGEQDDETELVEFNNLSAELRFFY